MSMESIRKYYGVPAKRGAKVRFTPEGNGHLAHEGVIVGSRGAYLRIRMNEEKAIKSYHPTWNMEYL